MLGRHLTPHSLPASGLVVVSHCSRWFSVAASRPLLDEREHLFSCHHDMRLHVSQFSLLSQWTRSSLRMPCRRERQLQG